MLTNDSSSVSYLKGIRKNFLTLIILFIYSVNTAHSQNVRSETPPFKERLFFGGSFGLQLGTITDIEASPIIGFWVLPRIAVAAGPNYRYYKDPGNRTAIYGGRAYVDLVVIRDIGKVIPFGSNLGIFLHGENELLSLQSSFWKNPPYNSDRFFVNTILGGAGLSQQLGRRASLNFMFLWALNAPVYDIYSNPEIRVSFTF